MKPGSKTLQILSIGLKGIFRQALFQPEGIKESLYQNLVLIIRSRHKTIFHKKARHVPGFWKR